MILSFSFIVAKNFSSSIESTDLIHMLTLNCFSLVLLFSWCLTVQSRLQNSEIGGYLFHPYNTVLARWLFIIVVVVVVACRCITTIGETNSWGWRIEQPERGTNNANNRCLERVPTPALTKATVVVVVVVVVVVLLCNITPRPITTTTTTTTVVMVVTTTTTISWTYC